MRTVSYAIAGAALALAVLTGCTSGRPAGHPAGQASTPASGAPSVSTTEESSASPSAAAPTPVPTQAPPTAVPDGTSGISGVTLLDACPVEPIDPPCAIRPFSARVSITEASSATLVTTIVSGSDGRFRVALKPGRYVLRPATATGALPRSVPVVVDVQPGKYASVTVRFDSGIRMRA